eukprot:jgi/Tetstr1/424882/TSEL_015377.t1
MRPTTTGELLGSNQYEGAGGGNDPVHDARVAAPATEDEDVGDAHEAMVTYARGRDRRRFKAKNALTGEEQVAERLIYSRIFDPAKHERSAEVVDGLLAALEDKRLEAKGETAREKFERERREAEAKNKNDKGGKGRANG